MKKINPVKGFAYTLRNIDWAQVVKLILWCAFVGVLLFFLVAVMQERANVNGEIHTAVTIGGVDYTNINDIRAAIKSGVISDPTNDLPTAYTTMLSWAKYPMTDFSLMLFMPGALLPSATPADAWTLRWNNVTVAYSYLFITALIALVGIAMLVIINFTMYLEHHREHKYNLSVKYPNSQVNYDLFNVKMYADLVLNLAMVFAFFNFISTLIVIGYWLLLYTLNFIIEKIIAKLLSVKLPAAIKESANSFKPDKSMLFYLIAIMLFQNSYTIVKGVFINNFGVNLDLVISIILPIGTITLIIGLFIKNMMDSKVSSVKKGIKSMPATVSSFRVFFYTQKEESLDDYSFVSTLPPLVKNGLTSGSLNKKQAYVILTKLNQSIIFVEQAYAKDPKQKNYLLYVLFNLVSSTEEIDEILFNIQQIQTYKAGKK